MQAQHAASMPPPDPDIKREDLTIETNTNINAQIRVHTPLKAAHSRLPVGVYFHSGGFIMGDLDTEATFCDSLAKSLPCIIVQGDYRLGPENKHQAAFQDALSAWEWVWDHSEHLGGDQNKMFTIGGAVGGTLALAVAGLLVRNPMTQRQIKGCVALAPVTLHCDNIPAKYRGQHKSYEENANAWMVDEESMKIFMEAVQADSKDAVHFPALAARLHKDFPPTYIAVCGGDVLRDDGLIMERALSEAGARTKLDEYRGMPHFFWVFPLPQSQDFNRNLLLGINFVLNDS